MVDSERVRELKGDWKDWDGIEWDGIEWDWMGWEMNASGVFR